MSTKLVDASCAPGQIVTIDGSVVPDVEVLSEGTKASSGVALVGQDKVAYITSNASDLKKAIEDVSAILDKVITVVTGLDAVTVSPGSQAANIALLTAAKVQFLATKETLK